MFEARAPGAGAAAFPRWLGDIGGTHARFAWQAAAQAPLAHVRTLATAQHDSLEEAARAYLRLEGLPAPACAAFGIATAVTGDRVAMTNHPWAFSVERLRRALGLQRLVLLNDFTALALALPGLPASHRRQVGPGRAAPLAPVALIGPGTGLGVSGLLHHQGQWVPLAGEGGHATLAAETALEFALLQRLRERHGHVSAERVLSGPGLVALHQALCGLRQEAGPQPQTPAAVLAQALERPGSTAGQALDLFCGWLGSMAGNLALTLGARGGLYLGGGIVPRLGERLDASPFRARFEAKGRFSAYLREIPTWVVTSAQSPALAGAAQALGPDAG